MNRRIPPTRQNLLRIRRETTRTREGLALLQSKRQALMHAFLASVQERVTFVNELTVSEPRTRELKPILEKLELQRGLIVVEAFDDNLWLAARNLPGLNIESADVVNPYLLVGAERVVMTSAAARMLEERMK